MIDLRFFNLSEYHPENTFNMLAVLSAMPSSNPIKAVLAPRTLDKNIGRRG